MLKPRAEKWRDELLYTHRKKPKGRVGRTLGIGVDHGGHREARLSGAVCSTVGSERKPLSRPWGQRMVRMCLGCSGFERFLFTQRYWVFSALVSANLSENLILASLLT